MTMTEPTSPVKDDELVAEGGCHCGGVRFRVRLRGRTAVLHRCNCSICEKTGFLHLIVPAADFQLLEGESLLTEYRFHTRVARHFFCRVCGVKSFYVPRSNPDGYSVNGRCLAWPAGVEIAVEEIDGRNWSAAAAHLRALTAPGETP